MKRYNMGGTTPSKRHAGMLLETRRAMILHKHLLRRLSNNIILETHPGLGVLPHVPCDVFQSLA